MALEAPICSSCGSKCVWTDSSKTSWYCPNCEDQPED